MRLIHAFVTFTLGALLFSQASSVYANELLVARFSTSNIEPWGFINEKGVPTGLLIKLANALEKELATDGDNGVKIVNQVRPYPRVIRELEKGAVDFAVMFKSPEADKIGISVGKVADHKVLLIGLADIPAIKNLSQLENKHIGYIRGSKYGPLFDNNKSLNKVSLGSMEQGINMVLLRRIYALASADQTLYFALKELKIPSQKITTLMTINQVSTELYFSKASIRTELIPPLTEALSRLKAKGVLSTIFYKEGYVPQYLNRTPKPAPQS